MWRMHVSLALGVLGMKDASQFSTNGGMDGQGLSLRCVVAQ